MLSTAIRLSPHIINDARRRAEAEFRTLPKHIEFYYTLARTARDNPDLPISFIENALLAREESTSPFEFRTTKQERKEYANSSKK
jgi:hypothetical protein